MYRNQAGDLIFSPSDLIRYMGSPFASWMDRYHLESPGELTPDRPSEDQELIMQLGNDHEAAVLEEFRASGVDLAEIDAKSFDAAHQDTLAAFGAKRQLVFQAALKLDRFQGHADFVELCPTSGYIVWDTKLARSPKPYYIIQLCAYSEMIADLTGRQPDRFGVILGSGDRVEFRLEDFIHYYRRVKGNMLAMHDAFTCRLEDRPEPTPRADHGRWASHAESYFAETDHLVRVAGITVGQIKKLERAGVTTMTQLAQAGGRKVPKLNRDTLEKLTAQASLQCATMTARQGDPEHPPVYDVLPAILANGQPNGLTRLPAPHHADVFFDMEGYPLVPGGLEYLFGLVAREQPDGELAFREWWAHDRAQEKLAFEGFVDYAHERWRANPGMHIYHYAPYEVSAVRRLSTQHDTRQDEVDDLLRNDVFVDLYQTVRQSLMFGEDSYSIKRLEQLYWHKRDTDVGTAVDSIVQYANWLGGNEGHDPTKSNILRDIRAYNEDDCLSTAALADWLRTVAAKHGLSAEHEPASEEPQEDRPVNPAVEARAAAAASLRERGDHLSKTLADVLDYHRREDKPKWWRLFDRAEASEDELRDDPGCIAGVTATGEPEPVKRSFQQWYEFDPAQECKLTDDKQVWFAHDLGVKVTLSELDLPNGRLALKAGEKTIEKFHDGFPVHGSLLVDETVPQDTMRDALTDVAAQLLNGEQIAPSITALLERIAPTAPIRRDGESEVDAARRVTANMAGGCFIIQGPPGTGKTYTASRAIAGLLASGKTVGITSNSHKAVLNLMRACGEAMAENGVAITGIKAGGESSEEIYTDFPGIAHARSNPKAHDDYQGGVIGGTAWLFSRPEWVGELDYLFIDEAGQVPLANAVAVARSATNIVLLGDQMQLEQPVQGTHPGDAAMSVLQYGLKNEAASLPDAPVYYPVIPADKGLFLGTSRRMHPNVCQFISSSIYDGRLDAHPDCATQKIDRTEADLIERESGIVFSPVEHDGNVQRSDEEVERVVAVLEELLGQNYTDKAGETKPLTLDDFLFIAPYNAQVRALIDALPAGAKVGSVDRFQGQEAPVCVLSLCSSPGEYGSRGLGFILDRNRINVAISRSQVLAVVVADPRIADTLPTSIGEMRLLSLFCKALQA